MADDAEQKRLDTIHNESMKLAANCLNGIAIATYAVGGFAPFVALVSGNQPSPGALALITLCPLGAPALHHVGHLVLRRMQ